LIQTYFGAIGESPQHKCLEKKGLIKKNRQELSEMPEIRRLLLFLGCREELLQGCHHGWGFRLGRHDAQLEAGFFYRFGGIVAECPDDRAVLLELGHIIKEAFHAAGRKEADHIVFIGGQHILYIAAGSTVHEGK